MLHIHNSKMTVLGVLPVDWEVSNIQDCFQKNENIKIGPFGSQLKKEYLLPRGDYYVYGQENVYQDDFHICYRFLSFQRFNSLKSCEIRPGDFVVSTMGTIGKCAVVPDYAHTGIMDSHLVRMRFNDSINKSFFAYLFRSRVIQDQIRKLSVGGIMEGLSTSILKKINVILPPIQEQKRIAGALLSVDKMIGALDKAIAKKRQIKEGLMQQLLTGKTRLPGFTGEWKETRLGDIFDFYKGTGLSKADIDSTGNNQCILYGEIFTKYNIAVKGEISRTASCVGTPSVKGDILMPGSTTTVGIDLVKAVFVDTDSILLGGDIIILRKKEQVDSAFFAMLISNISRNVVAEKAQGTTIIHLHGKDLTDIRYLVPESEQEQKGISTVVSKVDADIEELNYKKNKLILLKQGMMQELLTGKTRLI